MRKEDIHTYYKDLYRNPMGIASLELPKASALKKSLQYNCDHAFNELLQKLQIRLIVSREYEHLLLELGSNKGEFFQNYFPIAHPSGIAIKEDSIYVAATRNPNTLVELCPSKGFMPRKDDKRKFEDESYFLPSRMKYYPGASYFHDLVFIGNDLYANSVGQNAIMRLDINSNQPDDIVWTPTLKNKTQKEVIQENQLQINSIAAGKSIEESYFTASSAQIGKYKPGHAKFPVDQQGLVFSGKGELLAHGLTRPHSARMHQGKLYLNNSGYGGFGVVEDGKFRNIISLGSWTRGLLFVEPYVFIGLSRVLPQYTQYAPGIEAKKSKSGIVAFNMETGKIEAGITFPYGNQIFGIEALPNSVAAHLFGSSIYRYPGIMKSIFYKYKR
jgi:uncharacterized protein (TIGR03032 family)